MSGPPRPKAGTTLAITDERFEEDVALAASLGIAAIRFDMRWSATQQRPASANGDEIERVRAAAAVAVAAGLQPWVRLMQPDLPHWFDDEGGLGDASTTARWWPRWVEAAADSIGDVVAGWVPFTAPFAIAQRLEPDDPRRRAELVDTLVVAWRDAWRILRGGPPVATALDLAVVRATDDSKEAIEAAGRLDQLRCGVWLDGLRDGRVRIPGRADRDLPDLAGGCDVLGIAVGGDVETLLYRAAEQGPRRPTALTLRPAGSTDAQRARAITTAWREVDRAAEEVGLTTFTVTPFVDLPPAAAGLVTRDRELKGSGEAFVAGATPN